MNSLLRKLAELILRRPLLIIAGTLLGCLALGLPALRAPVDLSFTSMMNPQEPLFARYFEYSKKLNLAGRLPLLLEGDAAALDKAVVELTATLQATPFVDRVISDLPTQWLKDQAPWLVDDQLFDDWLRLATHPEDGAAARRLEKEFKRREREQEQLHPPGVRLLVVLMQHDPLIRPLGDNGFGEIEQTTQEVLSPLGVTGSYTGLAAVGQQDQEQVLQKIQILTPLGLLLVLLLLRLVEPRLRYLAAVAAPLVLAFVATVGMVSWLTGSISVVDSFFGVMVFGLGVDFALHLMVRLRDEQQRGHSFPQALVTTLVHTGRGVVAGALTTAGAFAIVALPSDLVARHLGLSGGIGLLLCLLLMLTLLPALWIVLGQKAPPPRRRPLALPLLHRLATLATQRPMVVVVCSVLLVVLALLGAHRFRFETDLQKVFNRQVPAMDTMRRIQSLYQVNSGPWISVVDSVAEADRVSRAFRANPLFSKAVSAADVLPLAAEERMARMVAAREDIVDQKRAYQVLQYFDEDDTRLADAVEALQTLQNAITSGPPTPGSLPPALRQQFVGPRGQFLVYAYVAQPTIDGQRARQERLAAEKIVSNTASATLVVEAFMMGDRPWIKPVFLGILVFVLLLLSVDLRSARWVLIALTPVLFGTTVTFGLLCWFNLGFNVMTTVVVPLIIGLGVDDGIHVVHAIRERSYGSTAAACASVAQAILMTTVTTCVSFVVMLFTDHAGLESMALVLIIGLPLCLLATLTLIPALTALTAPADTR